MDTLYIIGNGFDLVHDLKTEYKDYKNYLKCNNFNVLCTIEKYCSIKKLWSDFEEALGSIDFDAVQDEALEYLVPYGSDGWSDASHYAPKVQAELILENLTTNMRSLFLKWISIINVKSTIRLNINNNARFLTFNYTKTLQTLYDIPEENINHIHGSIEQKNIVLGHSCNTNDSIEEEFISSPDYDSRANDVYEFVPKYYQANFKNISNILEDHQSYFDELANIKFLYVIGHSLSEVDDEYFYELVKSVNENARWYITYYDKIDEDNFFDKLNYYGVSESNIFTIHVDKLRIN